VVEPVAGQRLDELRLEGEALLAEVGGVLGLRVDADVPAQLPGQSLGEIDDLLQGGHLVAAVEDRVPLAELRDAFLGPQRLQLAQREVLGEPAGGRHAVQRLGRPAGGELRAAGHVGGAADLRLVPGDQHAILGDHQIGLDVVRAHPRGQLVGGQGVLRPVAGRAAVSDDQRPGFLVATVGDGRLGHDRRSTADQGQRRR
jgi:hypothetical protein